jgi:hypothetical protein
VNASNRLELAANLSGEPGSDDARGRRTNHDLNAGYVGIFGSSDTIGSESAAHLNLIKPPHERVVATSLKIT